MAETEKDQDQLEKKRSLHFLCRIFGHRHKMWLENNNPDEVRFSNRCSRCMEQIPAYSDPNFTFKGDWVSLCKVFGHKINLKKIFLKGDMLYGRSVDAWCCWRCHKTTPQWNKLHIS
ncbi:MAG: hypothetical protein KGI60_04970 [Patescibacteria group bacterium]|nr:hypothetical protein [Patescibacteria group bacterium]